MRWNVGSWAGRATSAFDLQRQAGGLAKLPVGVVVVARGLLDGAVLRLLHRRFAPLPPAVEPRLRAASLAELDRWADRILDAATLDAVFATG